MSKPLLSCNYDYICRLWFVIGCALIRTHILQLDDDNAIKKMKIRNIGGRNYLYVNTFSKLYRISLERCSRHSSCRYTHYHNEILVKVAEWKFININVYMYMCVHVHVCTCDSFTVMQDRTQNTCSEVHNYM